MRNESLKGCDSSTIEVIYSNASVYDDLLISMDDCSSSSSSSYTDGDTRDSSYETDESYSDFDNTRETTLNTEESCSALFTSSYYEDAQAEVESDDDEEVITFEDDENPLSVSDILGMLESDSDSSETGWFSNLKKHLAEEHLTENRVTPARNKPVVLSIISYKREGGDVEEKENQEEVGKDKEDCIDQENQKDLDDEEARDDEGEEECIEFEVEQREEGEEESEGENGSGADKMTQTGIESEMSERTESDSVDLEMEQDPVSSDGTRPRGRSRRPRSVDRSVLERDAISQINPGVCASESDKTSNTKNTEPISITETSSATKQGDASVANETEAVPPSQINSDLGAAKSHPTITSKHSESISITRTFSTIKQGIESVATWSKRDMQVVVIEDCDTEEMENHGQEISYIAPQAIEVSSKPKLRKSLKTIQDHVQRKRRVLERRLGMEYGAHRRLLKKQYIRQYVSNGHVNIGAIIADIRMVETLQAIYKFVHERQAKIQKKMTGEYQIHKRLMKNKKKKGGIEKPSIQNMKNKFLKAKSHIRREIHETKSTGYLNIAKHIQKKVHRHKSKRTKQHQPSSYKAESIVPSHRCKE